MTVERLAVAVLLCAGLDSTIADAEAPVVPLSVAVPPSGKVSGTSEKEPAAAGDPKPEPAREPGAGPPSEEEYIPLDLPVEGGGDKAGASHVTAEPSSVDSSDAQSSAPKPEDPAKDKKPPAAVGSYFVYAEIFGIPNGDGIISASLCTRKNFTKSGCRTERVAAHEGQVSVVFDNVAPGTYAVQVHHDENGNGKMDYTFFGLPKEPYGFSRDAKPVLAPPKFKSASFDVVDTDVSLVIHLQNT